MLGWNPNTVNPPSTQITCPVMYDAAGKQRKVTKEETSSGSAMRLRGVRDKISSTNFWFWNNYKKKKGFAWENMKNVYWR